MWIFYRIKYFVENFLYGIKRFIQRGKEDIQIMIFLICLIGL